MEILKTVGRPVNAVVEQLPDLSVPLEATIRGFGSFLRKVASESDYERSSDQELVAPPPRRIIRDAEFYHSHKVEAERPLVGSVPAPRIFNGGPDRRVGERRRANIGCVEDHRQTGRDRRGAYLIPS